MIQMFDFLKKKPRSVVLEEQLNNLINQGSVYIENFI